MPKDLPDDPVLLKQLLEQMLSERESDKGKIVHLEEENALLRQPASKPRGRGIHLFTSTHHQTEVLRLDTPRL